MPTNIFARQALTPEGWRHDIQVTLEAGLITHIGRSEAIPDHRVGILLPALSNVHSHSFQRAMAGLAERRGPNAIDDFWTWRKVMYRFLELLSPEDIGCIAAFVQMEMLEAGYAAQAEFHYVHHGPSGQAYGQIDETSQRHIEAAKRTGIGYTHLPVLYMQGGLDGGPLEDGQLRFGCDIEQFQDLHSAITRTFMNAPEDFVLGVAPHSLRAVPRAGLETCAELAPTGPIHIHAAEQVGEVRDVEAALGARPVRWLLDHQRIDSRWCLIHATHLDDSEVDDLAASGAVAGLCPITEANLGDGIFPADRFAAQGGTFGVGSDSNVKIALGEELRMLELSQRLRDRRRVVLASDDLPSNGRFLYDKAAAGGAQAIGRNSGRIEIGALADLVALDDTHLAIAGLNGDAILDAWVFSSTDDLVHDVWSAGRRVVEAGRHVHHEEISTAFGTTLRRLRQAL